MTQITQLSDIFEELNCLRTSSLEKTQSFKKLQNQNKNLEESNSILMEENRIIKDHLLKANDKICYLSKKIIEYSQKLFQYDEEIEQLNEIVQALKKQAEKVSEQLVLSKKQPSIFNEEIMKNVATEPPKEDQENSEIQRSFRQLKSMRHAQIFQSSPDAIEELKEEQMISTLEPNHNESIEQKLETHFLNLIINEKRQHQSLKKTKIKEVIRQEKLRLTAFVSNINFELGEKGHPETFIKKFIDNLFPGSSSGVQ